MVVTRPEDLSLDGGRSWGETRCPLWERIVSGSGWDPSATGSGNQRSVNHESCLFSSPSFSFPSFSFPSFSFLSLSFRNLWIDGLLWWRCVFLGVIVVIWCLSSPSTPFRKMVDAVLCYLPPFFPGERSEFQRLKGGWCNFHWMTRRAKNATPMETGLTGSFLWVILNLRHQFSKFSGLYRQPVAPTQIFGPSRVNPGVLAHIKSDPPRIFQPRTSNLNPHPDTLQLYRLHRSQCSVNTFIHSIHSSKQASGCAKLEINPFPSIFLFLCSFARYKSSSSSSLDALKVQRRRSRQ